MNVHPTKNGINRYWSIPKCLSVNPQFVPLLLTWQPGHSSRSASPLAAAGATAAMHRWFLKSPKAPVPSMVLGYFFRASGLRNSSLSFFSQFGHGKTSQNTMLCWIFNPSTQWITIMEISLLLYIMDISNILPPIPKNPWSPPGALIYTSRSSKAKAITGRGRESALFFSSWQVALGFIC